MKSIRSGKGLGDNLYLQSIVRHMVAKGQRLEVCTDWPDVFRPLRGSIALSPHRRLGISMVSHYTTRKTIAGTSQFEDCCINAGVHEPVDLRLDWKPVDTRWSWRLKAAGKPVVLVQMPREPFGRMDGYGMELLPRLEALQATLDAIGRHATTALVGSGEGRGELRGATHDLTNKTTVCDLLDLAAAADAFVGYCSFFVPLAESFSKPALLVWSRRGLQSRNDYIGTITPEKILHRATSRAIVDDCSGPELAGAVDATLCDALGSRTAVCG